MTVVYVLRFIKSVVIKAIIHIKSRKSIIIIKMLLTGMQGVNKSLISITMILTHLQNNFYYVIINHIFGYITNQP